MSQTLTYEDVTLNTSCARSSYFIATTLFGWPASVWISLPLLRSQIFTVLSNDKNNNVKMKYYTFVWKII